MFKSIQQALQYVLLASSIHSSPQKESRAFWGSPKPRMIGWKSDLENERRKMTNRKSKKLWAIHAYCLEAQNIITCLSEFSRTKVYNAASFISKGTKAYSWVHFSTVLKLCKEEKLYKDHRFDLAILSTPEKSQEINWYILVIPDDANCWTLQCYRQTLQRLIVLIEDCFNGRTEKTNLQILALGDALEDELQIVSVIRHRV